MVPPAGSWFTGWHKRAAASACTLAPACARATLRGNRRLSRANRRTGPPGWEADAQPSSWVTARRRAQLPRLPTMQALSLPLAPHSPAPGGLSQPLGSFASPSGERYHAGVLSHYIRGPCVRGREWRPGLGVAQWPSATLSCPRSGVQSQAPLHQTNKV